MRLPSSSKSPKARREPALVDYASAGIPVYWIINLNDWQIEVYTQPEIRDGQAGYASRRDVSIEGEVELTIDGVDVARLPARSILPGDRPLAV